jgi:hypothetical protein
MKHIDIGTIHAFLDGELSGDALEFAASHFSICDACSNLMLEAENETDAVMQAFSIENAYAVPTQRIWARINNEIDQLDPIPASAMQPVSIWQTAFGWLGLSSLPQFAAPTAGLALGAALIAFFSFSGIFQQANPENNLPIIAQNENPPPTIANVKPTDSNPSVEPQTTTPSIAIENEPQKRPGGFEAVKANYRVEAKPKVVIPKNNVSPKSKVDLNAPLVEERLYLEAINDLSQTVASSDEAAMRPSFRVEYEQNVAMIDQAIVKMQRQVRRNPNDENAKRILFSSYQNKIDLLNTVAEKTQLMATVR